MSGEAIPLRQTLRDCPSGCGLPAEAAERAAADSRIEATLRTQGEHLAQISGALNGSRTALRVLLALAITSAAKWAPELLQTLIDNLF